MTETEPLCIVRHPLYGVVWLSTASMAIFNASLHSSDAIRKVEQADKKQCHWCPRHLGEMKETEKWYYYNDAFYCAPCFATLASRTLDIQDKERKMPHFIKTVRQEIETHRLFTQMEPRIMTFYENNADNNKNIRLVWTYLYHGVKPFFDEYAQ